MDKRQPRSSSMLHTWLADLRAQLSKFLLGLLDLMKSECKNIMLLGVIDISILITHAHQVEGFKHREMAKNKKRPDHKIMNTYAKIKLWELLNVLEISIAPAPSSSSTTSLRLHVLVSTSGNKISPACPMSC